MARQLSPRLFASTLRVMVAVFALLFANLSFAQTTQPAETETLASRAELAFSRSQYAIALPLLQKLQDQYKNNPEKLAPIQEQIRVCEKNIAMAAAGLIQDPNQTPDPESSADKRARHVAPKAGEALSLNIKELGNFIYDAEKGGDIPADVLGLSGSTIRLNGFMIPMDQAQSITQFALVPSLFACCFGQPPQIQHTIIVNCPKGKAVSYFPDEITVEGKLKVEEKKEDGFIVSIFEIECTSVKPVAK